MSKRILLIILTAVVMQLVGCASADRTPLVKSQTTARPNPPSDAAASPGSIFPVSQLGMTGAYRPLFEDRRARAVRDFSTNFCARPETYCVFRDASPSRHLQSRLGSRVRRREFHKARSFRRAWPSSGSQQGA